MAWFLRFLFLLLGFQMQLVLALRLTGTVIPEYSILSKGTLLECHFKLENDSLYSLKWYKDEKEFFRYQPTQQQPISTFPVDGVYVNINESSLNYVQLEPITLYSKGVYRCEISADAPSFQTRYEDNYMRVLALPEKGPSISGVHPWYNIGDNFGAKCHVHKNFPSSKLTWFINDAPVDPEVCECITSETFESGKALDGTDYYSSTSHLKFQVDSHYFRDGSIIVECRATFPKSKIVLKDTFQANIKSGFGFRLYADSLSGTAKKSDCTKLSLVFTLVLVLSTCL